MTLPALSVAFDFAFAFAFDLALAGVTSSAALSVAGVAAPFLPCQPYKFNPRRDNSKGNIIGLFNTNKVYQFIFMAINGKLVNMDTVLILIDIPKPHLRRFSGRFF